MINVTFRPLERWVREETARAQRKSSRYFKAGYSATLDLLEQELRHLAAAEIVIEIETTLRDIRNDGWPRSDARVAGPRVAVSFQSRYGPLTYFCDDCCDWTHNIRCIALTLERLRTAEMYGVTKRGEQYEGFKRLPGSGQTAPAGVGAGGRIHAGMSVEEAVGYIAARGGGDPGNIMASVDYFSKSYRRAALACHPDRHPELAGDWKKLQEAAGVLKRHHRIG